MVIKKGTTVYPSEVGHNNFYYPHIDNPYILTMDIEVERIAWTPREEKYPVRVCSPENYLPYKVLWIELPV